MSPEILSLEQACAVIRRGGVIAYPTETFFGLGCCALDGDAVASVFAAKRRAPDMPLPVIAGDVDQLALVAAHVSDAARALAERFWPGPLSILFPAHPAVPPVLTGGTGTVAVRVSPHPGARALALGSGAPLAATSANISGRPAVTSATELDVELLQAIEGVFDMPPQPAGGMASTLVCCDDSGRLRILRDGPVSSEMLRAAGYELIR